MKTRRGFTMLEMLVVIGVILLLVTIAVAAYGKIINAMAVKATGVALQNCQSFLAEYEQVTPISGMGYVGGIPDPNFPYLGGSGYNASDLSKGVLISTAPPIDGTDLNFAGFVTPPASGPWTRFPANTGDQKENKQYVQAAHATDAVYNTACVMMYLARVPNINAQLKALAAKNFLLNNDTPANPITLTVSTGAGSIEVAPAPVLVDGWNNPIIFVPASGISVYVTQGNAKYAAGTPANYVVRTSGVYPVANLPPVKSTDRPFWASAGPDGNFATGDDNVYSFK